MSSTPRRVPSASDFSLAAGRSDRRPPADDAVDPGDAPSRLIVTSNVDHIVCLRRDAAFRAAYRSAWLITADGMPVYLFARLRGAAPQRTRPRLRPHRHADRPVRLRPAPAVLRLRQRRRGRGAERPARPARLRSRLRRLRRAAVRLRGGRSLLPRSRPPDPGAWHHASRLRPRRSEVRDLGASSPASDRRLLRAAGRGRPRIHRRPEAPRAEGPAPDRPRMGLASPPRAAPPVPPLRHQLLAVSRGGLGRPACGGRC